MISKKILSREIIPNPYGKSDMCNLNTYHAEEAYKFLEKVAQKEIPYVTDLYAMLVNTMERFYKGILEEFSLLSDYSPNPAIMATHRLDMILSEINNFVFPIIDNQENLDYVLEKLSKISDGYTKSRYKEVYEYSDFMKTFDYFSRQRQKIYELLDQKNIEKENNGFEH